MFLVLKIIIFLYHNLRVFFFYIYADITNAANHNTKTYQPVINDAHFLKSNKLNNDSYKVFTELHFNICFLLKYTLFYKSSTSGVDICF